MPATPPPAPVQVAPLVVVDTSVLTVTLDSGKLTIRLTDEERDTWMRLVMPDGSISPVTTRPNCDCIGLNRHTLRMLNLAFLAGMRVESSDTMTGPWTLAAWTQAAATAPTPAHPPVTGPSLTIADASLVTTELEDGTVKVKLTDDQGGVWLRLVLSDGSVSPITISPSCACIGLGGDAPHVLRFGAVRGVRVEVSRLMDGPWTLAASID
ncbi:hypothetical protein Q0M94_26310 (plasmid) [Deinococcus radiomollis]|uniref:hypothetical protein n=1 Tax=Deinococcus radiomollis TaxID=468916 RepID=UPI0038914C0B